MVPRHQHSNSQRFSGSHANPMDFILWICFCAYSSNHISALTSSSFIVSRIGLTTGINFIGGKMTAKQSEEQSGGLPILTYTSPFLATATKKQALVILNSPIQSPPSPLFKHLWDTSSVRVCADGGANRLYRADPDLIPTLIRGDLDSLEPDVRSYYENKGVSIEREPDQNSNDLDKALTSLKDDFNRVVIYGAFGGRFDQEMGCIQALYKWGSHFKYRMVLFDDHTSAFLLPKGFKHEIRLPRYGDKKDIGGLGEGPTCGLIPIGCKCETVVTTGFKWNLDGSVPLEFGGLVSTSNHVSEEVATVEASDTIVFTAEVVSGLKSF
jgi:thiamine pyrophosphokinase